MHSPFADSRCRLEWAAFNSSDFRDFGVHGTRVRIDDLSAFSGRFVTRVFASVATVDCRPGLDFSSPTVISAFGSVLVVPTGGDQGSAEAPAAATIVAQRAPLPTSTLQEEDSAVITDPAASAPLLPDNPAPPSVLPPSGRISTRTRRQTAAAAGIAPPAVKYGFGPGGAPRPSVRRAITPPRAPRPRPPAPVVMAPAPAASSVPMVPIPSDRDRVEPVGTTLLRLAPPTDAPPVTTTDLDALGAAAEFSSVIPQRAIRMPTGLENNRPSPRATSACAT